MESAQQFRTTSAEKLKVGDTIAVWWRPNRDTITALYPYKGPLECLRGGQIAIFALLKGGMTIEPGSQYEVLVTEEVRS